ncbi:MAG TPA: ScyD/ScyE family protein [Saprospiraceae bacterium]|nr:ScyD/ScyE family protein [Saprospiraceae bacterium]HMQ82922.1 ScyD/ScyE family protein [Saprospiraceae bacterium]
MKQFFTLTSAFLFILNLTQAQPIIVGQGFVNGLIGVDVDADGNVWVTESGAGNDDGKVSIIAPDGSVATFMTGLPSALNPATGEIAGSTRTWQLPDNKVAVLVGEGPHPQGEALLIVDKGDYSPGSPLDLTDVEQTMKFGTFVHDQGLPQSNPYNIYWDENGDMYIADAGADAIVKYEVATEQLSFFAELPGVSNPTPVGPPVTDAVPTDIVPKRDHSGYYVCQLTGFPFLDGAATIYDVDLNGNLTPWQTGFTLLTDMGYDPRDSNLCVLQFSQFGFINDSTLNFFPGAGKVIKVFSDGSQEVLADGFIGLAPSFTFDAAGDLYVSDLFGFIYKYDLPSGTRENNLKSIQTTVFPNPAASQANFRFDLENTADVQLNIYNMHGQRVASVDAGTLLAGEQQISWNTEGVPTGTYLYHLLVDGYVSAGLLQVEK